MRVFFSINTYGCCHLIATNASSLTSSIAPLCVLLHSNRRRASACTTARVSGTVNRRQCGTTCRPSYWDTSKQVQVHLHRERDTCILVYTSNQISFSERKKRSCLEISLVSKSNLEISLGHSNWQKLSSSSAYNQRK